MTRDIRRELRSIRRAVDDADDPALDDDDVETITHGLTSDDGRTRNSAARALQQTPMEVVPGGTLRDPLVEAITASFDDDGKRSRRAAEQASRVLAEHQLQTETVDDDLVDLAERMLGVRNPFLRTGGAAMLGPALVVGEYDVGEDVVDDLTEHITMTELLTESFERRVDNLKPAFLVLAEADAGHSGAVAGGIQSAATEEYLHTHYGNARSITAKLLRSVADTEPDVVAEYSLDLVLRLRDDAPQTALNAGKALAELADERGIDLLRPTTQVLPRALATDDPGALTGVLEVLVTVVEADPEWTTELPIERVRDLQTDEAIADRPRIRSKVTTILGQYANKRDPSVVDEGFPEFVFGTVTREPAAEASFPNHPQIGSGLSDALTAAPETLVPATLAAGSEFAQGDFEGLTDLSPHASLLESFAAEVTDGADGEFDEATLPDAYLLALLAFSHAIEADEAVVAELRSVATDDSADLDTRHMAAEVALASTTGGLEDPTASRLAALGESLADADDPFLRDIGARIEAEL